MEGVKRGKREVKGTAKKEGQRAPRAARPAAKRTEKLGDWKRARERRLKSASQREELIKKLKGELAEKDKAIKESQRGLLGRARDSIRDWKGKAEGEARKLKAGLEAKGKALLEVKDKVETQARGRAEKIMEQKDALVERMKKEVANREGILRQGEKTVKEAMERAKKEVSVIKEKTDQTLADWKAKAEVEYKRLKEELEKKAHTLGEKVKDLEEYKTAAEQKISEMQAKAKELAGKAFGGKERTGLVTFKGNPMTLVGDGIQVGDKAPDFKVVDNGMQVATLDSFRGQIKVITSVPSLDTPVCDMETRRFNEEAEKLPENVVVLTVSMDLPFAQKRWCAAAGVEKVKTLSDFQGRSFGQAYGVLVKELQLLARAVFIVDDQDVIRYIEIVPEMTKEPDYDRALGAVKALL